MQYILRRFTRGGVGQATFNLFVWSAMMILTAAAPGQDHASKPLDIYVTSLIEASKPTEKLRAHPQPSESQTPFDVLVSKDQSVPAKYPEAVEGRRFEYLTSSELLARRKTAKEDFPVWIVSPATTVEGGRLGVRVWEDWIGIENGHLVFQISGWGDVFFRFDCGSGEFRFDEVKRGGI